MNEKLGVLIVIPTMLLASIVWSSGTVLGATDYTFASENIIKGASSNPTYRYTEDAAYNTLLETDQYPNTNFSGSSENIVTGTAGGGSFPSSLDTDDATRRSYTEANNNPADTTNYLYPTSDNSIGFDTTYPSSPTTHFDKIDEVTHDDDTTYNTAVTNDDRDVFNIGDLSGIVGTPVFYVVIHYWAMRAATGVSSMDVGLRIGSTDYVGINDVSAGAAYAELTYTWTLNPATSSAWTETTINSVLIYMQCSDAAPDVRVTQCYLEIQIDYAINYVLDSQITYSSVGSTAQTISYNVLCQGYRSGAENFGVYAWDYVALSWVSKTTIQAGSDTDYNFNLATNERSSGASEVKLRIVGLTETSDTTQDIVYFDLLKVNRIEKGYALDVELTSSSVAAYGNITLRIKGYSSSEQFNVNVWNYTSSTYQTQKIVITSLSNTWQTTYDLHDVHHRSGTSVKIQFTDETAYTGDTTIDTLYLDVAWVTLYYTDPVVSDYTEADIEIIEGENAIVWCTYTDYDNQAPSYVRVHVGASYYAMDANDSDTTYYDGKLYGKSISGLTVGVWDYWFATDDYESSEVATTPMYIITVLEPVNNPPSFTSTPDDTAHNNTLYTYDADATDADYDALTFDLEGTIISWATIAPTTGIIQGSPTVIGDYWMNVSVTDGEATIWQNTSISIFSDAPYFTSTPVTTGMVNDTFIYDANAHDNESEPLTYGIEGNITDWATIDSMTGVISGIPISAGIYWMNVTVTDHNNDVVSQSREVVISPEPISVGITTIQVILLVFILLFLGIATMYGLGAFD